MVSNTDSVRRSLHFQMTSFKTGDLVWAKMKGYSKWPGVVAEPTEELKPSRKGHYCIYFFGSNNYAWIEPKGLSPYDASVECKGKSGAFKDAVAAIERFKLTGEGGPTVVEMAADPFDELIHPTTSAPTSEKKGKASSGRKRQLSKDGSIASVADDDSASVEDGVSVSKTPKLNGPRKSTDTPKVGRPKLSLDSGSAKQKKKMSVSFAVHCTTGASQDSDTYKARPSEKHMFPQQNSPILDISSVSQTLLDKAVVASSQTFGFLGLGIMGCSIVKNLLNSHHEVHVWDRNPEQSQSLARIGAKVAMTPSDVAFIADITFSCVSDPEAAKDMVFGNCGILSEMGPTKGFIEMTGIDSVTSHTINEAISDRGGKYLEAQLQGSKSEALEGSLIVIAAGHRSLYDSARSCFEAIGETSFFLGEIGNATKMNLLLQMFMGIQLAGLSEVMALAERCNLKQFELLEILNCGNMASAFLAEKGKAIAECDFSTHLPLKHLQKDLHLALNLANSCDQNTYIAAASNEVFKYSKRSGYGDHDATAVYIRAR